MSPEKIREEYQALATKVGDLYFVIESAKAQLKALEDQMAQYHAQRNALQQAFTAAPAAPTAEAPPAEA